MVQSSIALLQERFRHLERAKEMRQQQERLRLFAQVEKLKPVTRYDQATIFFLSELVLLSRQPLQGSIHLQPKLRSNHHVDSEVGIDIGTQVLTTNWDKSCVSTHDHLALLDGRLDGSDVDTSLRL